MYLKASQFAIEAYNDATIAKEIVYLRPLSDRPQSELRRKKKDLIALSLNKTSLGQKRRILQKGGFLTALLPPILAVLGSLFAK